MKFGRISILRVGAALSCIGVVGAALLPDHGERIHISDCDKIDHVIAFLTLTVLATLALPNTRGVWIGGGLSLLGGAIELLQALPVIRRECSLRDWLADIAAIGTGMVLVKIYRLLRKRGTAAG